MTTMLEILSGDHGASVVELAERGRLGRSTAAKVLTALEARGLARRQSAEPANKRSPDLWFATTPPASAKAEPANASHTPLPENPATADKVPGSKAATAQHGDTHDQGTRTPESANDGVEPETAPDGEVEPDTTNTTTHAETTDDQPSATLTADDPAPTGGNAPAATARQRTPAETAAPPRLAKGGLRALVVDYLTAHPGEEMTAPKIGKSLGRSSGAVANALDTLVKNGQAELTREKPRTFRHHPAHNAD
jgi:DNA-binding MarR family transcriptional regulator